jgi:hypothetical protein
MKAIAEAHAQMSSGSGEQWTAGELIARPASLSLSFTCSPVPMLSCSIFVADDDKNGG